MRPPSTSLPYYWYLFVGGLVVIGPAFCCTWLIAITGFIHNPLPQVLRTTAEICVLGGFVGSIGYVLRRSLALTAGATLLATGCGVVYGLMLDDYVQPQLALLGSRRIYNASGRLLLALPSDYWWAYTAIPVGCIIVCSVGILLLLFGVEALIRRLWRRIRTHEPTADGHHTTY